MEKQREFLLTAHVYSINYHPQMRRESKGKLSNFIIKSQMFVNEIRRTPSVGMLQIRRSRRRVKQKSIIWRSTIAAHAFSPFISSPRSGLWFESKRSQKKDEKSQFGFPCERGIASEVKWSNNERYFLWRGNRHTTGNVSREAYNFRVLYRYFSLPAKLNGHENTVALDV